MLTRILNILRKFNKFSVTIDLARLDIGSAFELFYLGVLHPSNKIDPNASPSAPFISCLPMGTGRIERGNPQLIGLPIDVDAILLKTF